METMTINNKWINKKMKNQLLILMALLVITIGYSQIVENYTTYTVTSSSTISVTGYNYIATEGADVVIPAAVTDNSITYSVTNIGTVAFINKGLTSVIIPNTIINIGNAAFRINLLTNVTIPDSVITIGSGAFVSNPLMNSVVLGNNLETIGNSAFGGCAITNITIPDSVTSIIPPIITTGGSTDTFGDHSSIDLIISNGITGVYITDSGALWTGFNSVVLSTSNFELANNITVITTSDELKVTHSNNIKLQNYTIYNMSGAIVTTGKKSEIPTTYLASGIYILKLDFDKGIV